MAAAVIAQLARRLGAAAPRVVIVEPASAACVLSALEADAPRLTEGSLETLMDCLAAGRVSLAAWPILRAWADAAIALDDATCAHALDAARAGALGLTLDVGPSGIAGLAGLLALADAPDLRASLGLDARARVLVIGTEESLPAG
jgi:diaminopropionate ammonia-lyase